MFVRHAFVGGPTSSTFLRFQQALCVTVNHLYSPAALGVNGYQLSRERIKQQFSQLEDKFKSKMREHVENQSQMGTVFTEDLRNLVHLVEPTQEDLSLVKEMMVKFAGQNQELRFGSFVFGPVVMRMYYFLNKPKEAMDAYMNPALGGFFDQLGSFQILMDLLLKNELYDDVITIFEIIKTKQLQGSKYPKNAVVLVLAACYLKNTPDSWAYAKNLWADLNEVGHYPMRRAATFAAALGLAQKEPGIALEILTSIHNQTYVTVRNLKMAALADLGRPDDTLPILRSSLEFSDSATGRRHTFFREILQKVDSAMQKLSNNEVKEEFQSLLKKVEAYNLISNDPMDSQLCSEIEAVPPKPRQAQDAHFSYKQQGRPNRTFSDRSGVFSQF